MKIIMNLASSLDDVSGYYHGIILIYQGYCKILQRHYEDLTIIYVEGSMCTIC